jgi:TPR repeat protein
MKSRFILIITLIIVGHSSQSYASNLDITEERVPKKTRTSKAIETIKQFKKIIKKEGVTLGNYKEIITFFKSCKNEKIGSFLNTVYTYTPKPLKLYKLLSDPEEGALWLRLNYRVPKVLNLLQILADRGDRFAQYQYGLLCSDYEDGIEIHFSKAMHYLILSANQGHPEALSKYLELNFAYVVLNNLLVQCAEILYKTTK